MLSAVGGMYEDNLYLSTLYEYLETPVRPPAGNAKRGPQLLAGIAFENVSFTYPDASAPTADLRALQSNLSTLAAEATGLKPASASATGATNSTAVPR